MKAFRQSLLNWYALHKRDLPWRHTRDPYAIWLSEIMLQQTTVDTVIPYYHRFLEKFPTLQKLAVATEQEILSAWAGLGYYNRIRNFQEATRFLVKEKKGNVPNQLQELLDLPGLGPYTARAVASIAFGRPEAVVDGNVLRVLARVMACDKDIGLSAHREHYQKLADSLLDRENAGDFNQAMMELGATVCTPSKPTCLLCPVQSLCQGFQSQKVEELPVKSKKVRYTDEKLFCLIYQREGKFLLRQRGKGEIMAGLWELPLATYDAQAPLGFKTFPPVKHTIMTRRMTITPCVAKTTQKQPDIAGETEWVRLGDLAHKPLTTITKKVLKIFPSCP